MSEFRVCLDTTRHTSTPNPSTIHSISGDISSRIKLVNQDYIKSFVGLMAKEGCTICSSTYKTSFENISRDSDNFIQQQLFVLDFNRGMSFDEVKKRADQYDLPILSAYDTHSNGVRVLWLNDGSVRNHAVAKAMQKSLMTIFPEADQRCSDLSRLYYGGKRLLHFDETIPEINVDSLFMNMSLCLRKRYRPTHYKRKIAEFSKETGIRLNDRKLLDVSIVDDLAEVNRNNKEFIDGKKSLISTIDVYRNVENLPSLRYQLNFGDQEDKVLEGRKKSTKHRQYSSNDLKTLSSHCRLYREFESGNRLLTGRELQGLASVLIQAHTGDKEFKTILSENSYYSDQPEKYENWDYYFYYIKSRDSRPCASFCPYQSECPHGKDAWSTAKPKYHQVERVEHFDFVTRKEAEEQFKRIFRSIVNTKDTGWDVIKCQTALGKTEEVLKFLRDTQLNVLLALPTNGLKRDVERRAEEMEIDIVVSPSLHELEDHLPDEIWGEIKFRYDTGKSPMSYIKKHINEDNPECAALFKQYLRELDEFINAPGHAIATHRRLTHMDVSKYDLVIVDEDIILSTILTNRGTIRNKTLKELKTALTASDPLAAKIEEIIKHINDCKEESGYFTLAEVKYNRKAYAGIKMAVNIPALCSATHFCARKAANDDDELEKDCVVFQIPIIFPENTKYIMLSATTDKTICEHVLGADNVRFHECDLAGYEGTLYQDFSRTMSRGNISNDTSIFDRIAKSTGVEHTISFKKFQEKGLYDGDLTFSNCAGIDTLRGKDINVIGTPHQTDWIYKLFAYSHGFDVDSDERLKNIPIVHNGFRFIFKTYDDELLRAIQFYIIESDLEQAVGRARLLREDCTANLFSNFPLRQATPKKFDYDKEISE